MSVVQGCETIDVMLSMSCEYIYQILLKVSNKCYEVRDPDLKGVIGNLYISGSGKSNPCLSQNNRVLKRSMGCAEEMLKRSGMKKLQTSGSMKTVGSVL